jgi:hypothetical protein
MTQIILTSLLRSLLTSLLRFGFFILTKILNLDNFWWKTIQNQFLKYHACIVIKNVCAEVDMKLLT